MTDYRFVSAPDVVLRRFSNGDEAWGVIDSPSEYWIDEIQFLINKGIIEPVPVEIPDHVVEAAWRAFREAENHAPFPGGNLPCIRAALIAAKEAGL